MSRVRGVDLARCGLGVLALTRPEAVLTLSRRDEGPAVSRSVRVLGARYLIQSAGGIVLGRRWVPGVDAGIDLVHAASMLGLAAFVPTHRRIALISAGAATGFALADLKAVAKAGHEERTRP